MRRRPIMVWGFAAERIEEEPVGLHGVPDRVRYRSLGALLAAEPLILLTRDVAIRSGIQAQFARRGLEPRIAADVDDMVMVRLLAL